MTTARGTRLLLIGAPGSGKGTQGSRIAEIYGVEHIASGDILRANVEEGTDVGRQIERYLKAGELVPDELILGIIVPRVFAAAQHNGYVLDGFPRSLAQATEARRIADSEDVSARHAIYLQASPQELVARLLHRASIEGRPDDTPAVIEHRLDVFTQATSPVLDYYRDRGLLVVVDATLSPDEVTQQIVQAVGEPTAS